jgi:predicted Zn-dependent protease
VKRFAALAAIILVAGAAIYWNEHRHDETAVGPDTLLNWFADSQRQASRIPMKATRLSDAEERQIGDELASQYRRYLQSDWNAKRDVPIQQYIRDVGARVVGGSTKAPSIIGLRTKRHIEFNFYYVPDDDFVNAFALPGGHIFFGKGLLNLMDSEDQLAAVLGHEVEHVDRYHCVERVQLEARTRNLPLSGLASLPLMIFQAGYSKEQELEADREGTELAMVGGYSPEGAVRNFEMFERLYQEHVAHSRTPQQELSRVAVETLTGYFRSHPLPAERKRQIQDMIDRQRLAPKPEKPLQVHVKTK